MSGRVRNRRSGQALVFTVIVALVLICFVAVIVNTGQVISRKIKMQNCADASAVSGAVWQARGLNMIASLNVGILACETAILIMVIKIGISRGMLIPVLGPKIVKMYRIARKMARIQNTIKKTNPILVEGEALRIARVNGIKGAVALAPEVVPWPQLRIHRLGKPRYYNPGTSWEKRDEDDPGNYNPTDSNADPVIPLPYVRDNDFDKKQYVFCIAFDEPSEIIGPGKRIFGANNPVLIHMPKITVGDHKIGGDIGYITVAQARPVNKHEPAPLLLIPQWDIELTPVTAPGDIPIPGLKKIAKILQEDLLCH